MRVFSFAQESTRYCDYSKKSKFNNEITFIIPCWVGKEQENMSLADRDICGNTYAEVCFKEALIRAEESYFTLLKEGWKPQQARQVLPNALKTEICMTGFASDWRFFLDLRYYGETGKPHPDMELLAGKARSEFMAHGVWGDIMKYPSKFDK